MKRRDFVSRVTLGAAAVCTIARPAHAAAVSGQMRMRFVGMMTFIERADHSFLVATPGELAMQHHMNHVPFLMAKAGTPIAKALGMAPARGVVPAAFDTEFVGSNPCDYVYRNLNNTSIEIVSGADAVDNRATEMAQLQKIAPGKRVRGNIERWASTTVSLRGGRLENSSGHPDAGKVWSFGNYRQQLTDAVNFTNVDRAVTTIRLTSGTDVRSFTVAAGDPCDLSMISAAMPDARMNTPTKLVHSELLFEYLVDAKPVLAECAEATGREVPASEIPYVEPTSASAGIIASGNMFPPATDFCFVACILFGTSSGN